MKFCQAGVCLLIFMCMAEQDKMTDNKQKMEGELVEIEATMADPSFWQNKASAQETVARYHELKALLAGVGKYDKGDAIITIFSGAGGDDSEDFSRMLYEMYQKYCDKNKLEWRELHANMNDHGGYRNVTFEVGGPVPFTSAQGKVGPYAILKNESGVHRLVRISPFNAKQLRHTSFSLVEVIPKLSKVERLPIPIDELNIEFARSSGPGGQNVNKGETAVRIVHVPTGLSAHSSNQRSQLQNKETALEILSAKLWKRQEEDRVKKEKGMYISKTTEIEWGNQIRSYVLHPYKMVKDHRTNCESTQVDKVLAGEIEGFIEAERNL